jgi:hypothetical protein
MPAYIKAAIKKKFKQVNNIKAVTEYSVCGSRAWARSRLGRVTLESATYASPLAGLLRESEPTSKPTL